MEIGNREFTMCKDRRKKLRSVLQLLFLAVLAYVAFLALFTTKTYVPYQQQGTPISGDRGFVALSYFGVDRIGDQTLIGSERLRGHLSALKKQGYVTITQQDILDYYQLGKELPAKSLFLIFEDGRRDTAIFAQQIMEDLNYKGTALTYTEKFFKKDLKFLMPEELRDLRDTSFWEMGTNGYRLYYINVYDRYDNYLGEMDPLKYSMLMPCLGRRYNHYLMDYIRDEDFIPTESYSAMKNRISYDYENLEEIYTEELGYVPGMYILMHSNTGSFGNNDKVSAVNEYWIRKLFTMNFNREGYSFNKRNSSVYDLTRMQPQAYWHTNHLLMRIKYDVENADITFEEGDAERQRAWDVRRGAAEISGDSIALTCLPHDSGQMYLKDSHYKDLKLSVRLRGNKLGVQRIYLRTDEMLSRGVFVSIENNVLNITDLAGGETNLFWLDLDRLDGKKVLSVSEEQQAVEAHELKTFTRYAPTAEYGKIYVDRLKNRLKDTPPSVADGAEEYVPTISAHARGDRYLELELKGTLLTVKVDGKPAVTELPVKSDMAGAVMLETAWPGYGWSQRNLADDVYDGVFEKLIISQNTGKSFKDERILFDSRMSGVSGYLQVVKEYWEKLVQWFIVNF